MRWVALLRGVNVGGSRRVAMADLRALLTGLGYTDVTTYVQSGNAVFTAEEPDGDRVARAVEQRVDAELGLDVTVIVRSREELAAVVAANPYPDLVDAPTTLHVMFLAGPVRQDAFAGIDLASFAPEEVRAGDRVLYLRCPFGLGRSRLVAELTERRLGVRATMRNWRTVTKLLELAG